MAKVTSFEDLIVWQNAHILAEKTYVLSRKYLQKEYQLNNQMSGAVLSISNNISEGFEYNNRKDFSRFLVYAKGSAGEVRNMVYFMFNVKIINEEIKNELIKDCKEISSQLKKLIQHLAAFSNTKPTGNNKSSYVAESQEDYEPDFLTILSNINTEETFTHLKPCNFSTL